MATFGHVLKITKEVGDKVYTFRSKLEYKWAVWCQLRKEQGIIMDWEYESVEVKVKTKLGEIKIYRPDFIIKERCANIWFYEETKGWFTPKDYTKMKLFAEQYENPLTLIFASLNDNSKNSKIRAQHDRAKRLEPFLKRIIWKADRDIFRPIKHLFET